MSVGNYEGTKFPSVSVVMINWRNNEWTKEAITSVEGQFYKPDEFIIEDNKDNSRSIGKCWNDAVKKAKSDWVMFIGDDDYLSKDFILSLLIALTEAEKKKVQNIACVTSYLTAFTGEKAVPVLNRIWTGMWKKDFLLENPFDEELKRLVDTKYVEKYIGVDAQMIVAPHQYGYHYRQHEGKTSGKLNIGMDALNKEGKGKKIAVFDKFGSFTKEMVSRLSKDNTVLVSDELRANMLNWCDVAYFDWCDKNLIDATKIDLGSKKIIVRLHSFEAYNGSPAQVDWSKVDNLIFVAEHVKEFCLDNYDIPEEIISVQPQGVDLVKYTLPEKKRNNKIAYAGYFAQKKGMQLLTVIARQLKDYEFHLVGGFQEPDILQWVKMNKPDNMFLHDWTNDLKTFFSDKTYYISTAPREGVPVSVSEAMASGLKPMIFDWIGSRSIYKKEWVWETIDELKEILKGDYNPKEYREYAEKHFDYEDTYKLVKDMIYSSPTTKKIKAYYENFTKYLKRDREVSNGRLNVVCDIIDQVTEKYDVKTALDVGCGIGITTQRLFQNGLDVIGVDLSENNIKDAKEHSEAKFIAGDILSLNGELDSYDLVCLFDVVEHIPEERRGLLWDAVKKYSNDLVVMSLPDPEYQRKTLKENPDRLQIVDGWVEREEIEKHFEVINFAENENYNYYLLKV